MNVDFHVVTGIAVADRFLLLACAVTGSGCSLAMTDSEVVAAAEQA
jgi:hypothetical protein